jgi:hypothetical protein
MPDLTPDPPQPLDLAPILDRAAQLAEARAKATPGHWVYSRRPGRSAYPVRISAGSPADPARPSRGFEGRVAILAYFVDRSKNESDADAAFVALAHNLAVEEDVRALAAECERLRAENERLREVEAAARNYVHCTTNPRLSPYVRENGRHGRSPWAELIDAVDAAQGSRGGPTP